MTKIEKTMDEMREVMTEISSLESNGKIDTETAARLYQKVGRGLNCISETNTVLSNAFQGLTAYVK